MPPRYRRAPSPFLQDLLLGDFNFLVRNAHLHAGESHVLDLQFREHDELMLYLGTTCLLKMRFSRQSIRCSAADAHAREWPEVIREWSLTEAATQKFQRSISEYLAGAAQTAGAQYYANQAEGYWQNHLSLAMGLNWRPGIPWLILDREVVLAFSSNSEKENFWTPIKAKYDAVRNDLRVQSSSLFGTPNTKSFGDELDFLALTPSGHITCIELKDGTNASGIYWGSLQAAAYRDAYQQALPYIADGIKELTRAKVRLGLLDEGALKRLPEGPFVAVDALLAVARPNYQSACWNRLREVFDYCEQARIPVVETTSSLDVAFLPSDHFAKLK